MNAYSVLKGKHQEEVDNFPMKFAFSNEQFEKAMAEFGLTPNDTDKIYKFGNSGGLYLRTDSERLFEMIKRHDKELEDAIASDMTGEGFILDMFNYELANHEYSYTHNVQNALDALCMDIELVKKDHRLSHGLMLAKQKQLEEES